MRPSLAVSDRHQVFRASEGAPPSAGSPEPGSPA